MAGSEIVHAPYAVPITPGCRVEFPDGRRGAVVKSHFAQTMDAHGEWGRQFVGLICVIDGERCRAVFNVSELRVVEGEDGSNW